MSAQIETEGIVLETLPYQEHHHIVALFSRDQGMIRLFARNRRKQPLLTPLTRVACLYHTRQESALYPLREVQMLDPCLHLRQSYRALQLAGTLAQILLKTQLLWKPAPLLYQLLHTYLSHAHQCEQPTAFVASFRLKLLRHEGLLGLNTNCSECHQPLERAALVPGETLCPAHAPEWALLFSHTELLQLCQLTAARSLKEAYTVNLEPHFGEKIQSLFDQLLDN